MKKIITLFCLLFFSTASYASFNFGRMLHIISNIYGVNLHLEDLNNKQYAELMNVASGLTGTHNYGSLFDNSDQFDWGDNTDNWQDILALYQNGSGGELGAVSRDLARQFPISDKLGSSNPTEDAYYRLQAETSLASRSSSQLAFKQISKEAKVVDHLQNEIDRAKDNKSAVDLNNRLISEQNKLSIQQAKLLALLVQQQAVAAQQQANRAKEDAEFFRD